MLTKRNNDSPKSQGDEHLHAHWIPFFLLTHSCVILYIHFVYSTLYSFSYSNMFPQYPPFSNRIYVNPKFNKSGASQQMQLQQEQQRKFMELEAHRMLLMQRQMQLQQQQEQQRLTELEQKRREAAEHMKKRREQRNAEVIETCHCAQCTSIHCCHRRAKSV